MLTITIQGDELWDENLEQFCYSESIVLEFEHSLVSLSKWEEVFHKPFLTREEKTEAEMFGYVKAMLLTPNVSDETLMRLNASHYQEIDAYINNPMTGTTFSNQENRARSSERLSAELIYFWMSQYNIPYEARHWHLNKLFTLIRVHDSKTQKPKKMSQTAAAARMAEINRQRRERLGTSG